MAVALAALLKSARDPGGDASDLGRAIRWLQCCHRSATGTRRTGGGPGRVMSIAPVSSAIEVAAKLHCLIVTLDPSLKLEDAPWPQLRTMLKDLVRIAGMQTPETSRTAGKAFETKRDVAI